MFKISSKSNLIFPLKLTGYKVDKNRTTKHNIKQQYQKKYNNFKRNVATPEISTSSKQLQSTRLENEEELFSWTKQWYPIQVLMHLDVDRPTPVQLLGKDLVIWRDGDGKWVCFEDQCPHRLVPLSEGRLETDGTLQCSYHGWRFNGKGECVKIPQAEPELGEKLCSNERSCANVFPTQEKYGLLWIWGESGPDAKLECLLKQPAVPAALDTAKINHKNWQQRNLPYSQEFYIENVIDPAHTTVSHHQKNLIQTINRDDAKPLYFKLKEPAKKKTGFTLFRSESPIKNNQSQEELERWQLQFIPPCTINYQRKNSDVIFNMILLATPTTKGECRNFTIVVTQGPGAQKIKKRREQRFYFILPNIPKWYAHLNGNLFFQQDNVFLYGQEQIINQLKEKPVPITKAFYTPTISDLGVIELHKWYTMHGQGGVQYYSQMTPKIYTEEDLIDTYYSHTSLCKICQGALANFKKLQIAAWIACAVCAICAICAAFIDPFMQVNLFKFAMKLPALKVFLFGVFSVIFGAVGILSDKFIQRFYKTEYCHAEH